MAISALVIRQLNWGMGRFEDYSPTLRSNYDKEVSAYGISFQEVLYFAEKLTGRIGVASSRIKQTYQHKSTDRSPGEGEEADTNDSDSNYNVGLNYRVTPELAAFVNASQGRTAYSILGSINGQNNRPDSESKSIDVGMRFTAFDEDLLASLVWFETRRTTLRYNNPDFNDNPNDPEYNINVTRYYFYDESNNRSN